MRSEVYREPKHVGLCRGFVRLLSFTLNKMGSHWRILSRGVARSDLHFTIKINLFSVLKNKMKGSGNFGNAKTFRRPFQ